MEVNMEMTNLDCYQNTQSAEIDFAHKDFLKNPKRVSKKAYGKVLGKIFDRLYLKRTDRKDIVIDASAMAIVNIVSRINQMIEEGYRIILLETTREELDKLQKFTGEDVSKRNASKLLSISQGDREHFYNVRERFLFRDPDNRIAQFCMNNRDSVILWTADKRLAAEVNGSNCDVVYLGPDGMANAQPKTKRVAKFFQATMREGKLVISNNRTDREIWILRGNDCFKNPGNGFELQLNDQILVAIRKENHQYRKAYVAFAAYTVIKISDEQNVEVNYTHQYHDVYEPQTKLSNPQYRAFVLNFIEGHIKNFPYKIDEEEKMLIIKG
jgi:rRNA-processing protein FCF1